VLLSQDARAFFFNIHSIGRFNEHFTEINRFRRDNLVHFLLPAEPTSDWRFNSGYSCCAVSREPLLKLNLEFTARLGETWKKYARHSVLIVHLCRSAFGLVTGS